MFAQKKNANNSGSEQIKKEEQIHQFIKGKTNSHKTNYRKKIIETTE